MGLLLHQREETFIRYWFNRAPNYFNNIRMSTGKSIGYILQKACVKSRQSILALKFLNMYVWGHSQQVNHFRAREWKDMDIRTGTDALVMKCEAKTL